MAGMFSDVDFNRMQEQLLELREVSYKSEEKCKKQEKELNNAKEQLILVEKELHRANQIIIKSKKAKDLELAFNEIDSLQRKLQNHEEDSRLQNDTLMKELARLVGVNERLEGEVKEMREGEEDAGGRSDHRALQDELRRLQAQYSALQKCNRNLPEEGLLIECSNNSNGDEEINDENLDRSASERTERSSSKVDQSIADLQLKITIEKEENDLLKQQLTQIEMKYKEEMGSLKQENDGLSEKLRKKQESLLQLQNAKDQLFREMSSKLEAAQSEQKRSLEESRTKFSQESSSWISNKKNLEEEVNRLQRKFSEVQSEKVQLEEQMTQQGQESNRNLRDLQLDFELKIKKQSDIIGVLKEKIGNSKAQLKESQSALQQSTEEMAALRADRDMQAASLQEVTKLAEKRKSLLDQLAMKYQEDNDQHRDQLKELQGKHESAIKALNLELAQLKNQLKELKMVEEECGGLSQKLKNNENKMTQLEISLRDKENELRVALEVEEAKVCGLMSKHGSEVNQMKEEHEGRLQELSGTLCSREAEIESQKELIKNYEQMVKDHEGDKKLHEKKGSTVIKDLKRQLQAERKRVEKLQEKLQEILSDSKNRQSVEDLFRPIEDRIRFADNSSLSSWSPSGLSRENLMSQCSLQGTDEEPDATSTLRQETEELIKKNAELLLKVSTLEEKVSHLESSNAAMAEDLLQKTAVIDHYHMCDKAGQSATPHYNNEKMSLKRVMEFVTEKNDDRRDMNKRLQRVLEETLTKNMHLQNDLESLSKELSELKAQQTS